MKALAAPGTLFGVPLALRRADADQLVAALRDLWANQSGRPTGPLDGDLSSLEAIFRPTARGATVRNTVIRLAPAPRRASRFLREPLVLHAADIEILAPEGRILLEVLDGLSGEADVVVIDPDVAWAAEHRAYTLYRDWSTTRLMDVLGQLEGRESLRLPSVAAVLLLLVNGSGGEDRALHRLRETTDRMRLDVALGQIGLAFWDELDGTEKHDPRAFALYSGYAWTEAARRFPREIATNPWFVRPDGEEEVILGVVSELSRPQRYVSTERCLAAFGALVREYRREQPVLAGLGMSHHRTADTHRLKQRLEVLLGQRQGLP